MTGISMNVINASSKIQRNKLKQTTIKAKGIRKLMLFVRLHQNPEPDLPFKVLSTVNVDWW